METPSSVRKAPQSLIASYKTKQEGSKNDRSALIDITNDSPIVGLANGSNFFAKSAVKIDPTPGSGEAILRSQVKNLLQKIEEEIELAPKIPSFLPRHHLPPSRPGTLELACSPMQMLAPTPANTPQVTEDVQQGFLLPPPKIVSPIVQHDEPLGLCMLNRALLFDSPDKQEASSGSIGSSVTFLACQESVSSNGSFTISSERHSSIWSTQGNAGTDKGDDDTESEFDLEELCKGFKDMVVEGKKFEGKHTRFVYGSDGEMEAEECSGKGVAKSPSVVVLKGLPVPEGKHLRFQDEDEEGEN